MTIGQVPARCDAQTGLISGAPRAPWIAHGRRDLPHARALGPDRRQRAVLRERRDRRVRAAQAAGDQGRARPHELRAGPRRGRGSDRRPVDGPVRGRAHRALRERARRDGRGDGDRGPRARRRVRGLVGRPGPGVPRHGCVRRHDGRGDERPRNRRPASVRPLDPPGLPRHVERRLDDGRGDRRARGRARGAGERPSRAGRTGDGGRDPRDIAAPCSRPRSPTSIPRTRQRSNQ